MCDAGFLGATCDQLRCPDDCSGNGFCMQGQCECAKGWKGESCDTAVTTRPPVVFKLPQRYPKLRGLATPDQSSLRLSPHDACPNDCSGQERNKYIYTTTVETSPLFLCFFQGLRPLWCIPFFPHLWCIPFPLASQENGIHHSGVEKLTRSSLKGFLNRALFAYKK